MALDLPARICMPNGEIYTAVMMKIEVCDELGRPENLIFLPPDRPVEIVGGERFLIAYVDVRTLVKHEPITEEQNSGG